ncbi:MAG: hypothetical protein ACI82A_001310 [Candidatus Azotimanducaceae bacterium]
MTARSVTTLSVTALAGLKKPWLHFMVLGAVLFLLQSVLFPEPKIVIGPLSDARVGALKEQWRESAGRQPTSKQVAGFIAAELDGDMLFQRALELGLHLRDGVVYQRLIRNMKFLQLAMDKPDAELFDQALEIRLHLDDVVVKRRLIQMMEQQLLADNLPTKPSAAEVAMAFASKKEALQRPAVYSLQHIFFSGARAAEMASVITTIAEQKLEVEAARSLGSPFMQGYRFYRRTPSQLAKTFGRDFVSSLAQVHGDAGFKPQQWLGPIPSAYGLHYVWIDAYEPARDAALDEVEQQLRNDLEYTARAKALLCAVAGLRADYDIKGRGAGSLDANEAEDCL